jgi:hypothetical protein
MKEFLNFPIFNEWDFSPFFLPQQYIIQSTVTYFFIITEVIARGLGMLTIGRDGERGLRNMQHMVYYGLVNSLWFLIIGLVLLLDYQYAKRALLNTEEDRGVHKIILEKIDVMMKRLNLPQELKNKTQLKDYLRTIKFPIDISGLILRRGEKVVAYYQEVFKNALILRINHVYLERTRAGDLLFGGKLFKLELIGDCRDIIQEQEIETILNLEYNTSIATVKNSQEERRRGGGVRMIQAPEDFNPPPQTITLEYIEKFIKDYKTSPMSWLKEDVVFPLFTVLTGVSIQKKTHTQEEILSLLQQKDTYMYLEGKGGGDIDIHTLSTTQSPILTWVQDMNKVLETI